MFCSWQPCDLHPHIRSHCLNPWYWYALLPIEISRCFHGFLFQVLPLFQTSSERVLFISLRQLWVSRVGNWAASPNPHVFLCFWERVSLNIPGYPQSFQPAASAFRVLGYKACTTLPSEDWLVLICSIFFTIYFDRAHSPPPRLIIFFVFQNASSFVHFAIFSLLLIMTPQWLFL